jgi:hypothetical protein
MFLREFLPMATNVCLRLLHFHLEHPICGAGQESHRLGLLSGYLIKAGDNGQQMYRDFACSPSAKSGHERTLSRDTVAILVFGRKCTSSNKVAIRISKVRRHQPFRQTIADRDVESIGSSEYSSITSPPSRNPPAMTHVKRIMDRLPFFE